MYAVSVRDATSPWFPIVWEVYESAFPESERRSLPAQLEVFRQPNYRLDAWFDAWFDADAVPHAKHGARPDIRGDGRDAFIGFMGWWEYDDFRYIEHIAIAPQARSGGKGSTLLQSWMDNAQTPVVLEIDPVVDEVSQRRLHFYQRLGFVENDVEHQQPHFQGGSEMVPLRVLSFPALMSGEQVEAFMRALHNDVWATIGH